MTITWALEDHICRACGGRILRSVNGAGMTPGGNPLYKCSCCGKSAASMGPDSLCWCGLRHRAQGATPYRCLPMSILNDKPWLLEAFRASGCEPGRQEVGIVTEDHLRHLERKHEQGE